MPHAANEIKSSKYMRLLLLGGPKVGKSYTCVTTARGLGKGYVINSDDKYSLVAAAKANPNFDYDIALGSNWRDIESCIREAKVGVAAGTYQWVLWDTISKYAERVEDVFADATKNGAGEPDGRRYWPLYRKHLHGIIDRLFTLDAHVIVNAHFMEMPGVKLEGQNAKQGQGIVPLLGGVTRATVPAMFQDVVFMEKRGKDRFFVTSSDGVFGPGSRSLPGVESVPADLSDLWSKMQPPKKIKSKSETVTKPITKEIK